ncbi:hypothetical protein ACFFMN_23450 [Planobispora siamensis]|uniref:Uncharacterized protein n=1 Tax=Planobispora siamensis TaxID=936338 RepID=A0A8J3SIV0_9ACTN|nr:hypothetical protein [Planobispora siamensis]GIH95321.1 hypothetical protein Psi01_59510 [Planobispora siamensis]
MTARIAAEAPEDAATIVVGVIAELTLEGMRRGLTQEAAFDRAYTYMITRMAADAPHILEKCLGALVARNPELDRHIDGMPHIQAAVADWRSRYLLTD